jgi:hypothetical protein
MLRKGQEWNSRSEHIAVESEALLIRAALLADKSIIIDDTNLSPHHIKRYRGIAKDFGYSFELYETERSVARCIEIDEQSESKVGKDAILNSAFKYGLAEQNREFVVYDLDGTLVDDSDRLRLASTANGQIHEEIYYDEAVLPLDDVRVNMRALLFNDYDAGYEIFLVSNRKEKFRKITERFLESNVIPYHRLILKPDNDNRPEEEFKKSVLLSLTDLRFCLRVVDDNRKVIEMCQSLKIGTFDISDGALIECT